MIARTLCRALGATGDVTTDLYLRNACSDMLGGTIEQLAPTVFASRRACLVMRHGLAIPRLPERRRLIYLLDDDVEAGVRDRSLPWAYRQKLRLVEAAFLARLRRLAGVAVVGSERLTRLFDGIRTHVLHPFWSERFAALDHFDSCTPIDIAYLGSGAHRRDLRFLLPVFEALMDRHPHVRLHLPAEHRLPRTIADHPRLLRLPGPRWETYRRAISERRFHVALYPLTDGGFNRGRSANKLIEHAVVGAAPVYSRSWEWGRRADAAGAGLVLGADASDWVRGISALIHERARMRGLAEGAQQLAAAINRPEPQRRLWHELFEVSSDGGVA